MKDLYKKSMVFATPVVLGFFSSSYLSLSMAKIEYRSSLELFFRFSMNKEPSWKNGLIGGGIGLYLGFCMYMLIEGCTSEQKMKVQELNMEFKNGKAEVESLEKALEKKNELLEKTQSELRDIKQATNTYTL